MTTAMRSYCKKLNCERMDMSLHWQKSLVYVHLRLGMFGHSYFEHMHICDRFEERMYEIIKEVGGERVKRKKIKNNENAL